MKDNERRGAILKHLIAEHEDGTLGWWYLSFAGPEFLGAVIVQAMGMTDAITVTHASGINPGGEVLDIQFPDGKTPPSEYVGRLLTRADVERFDQAMR